MYFLRNDPEFLIDHYLNKSCVIRNRFDISRIYNMVEVNSTLWNFTLQCTS